MISGIGGQIRSIREKIARRDEGFTLVELLIVIVILGVLAAIVVIAVSGVTSRGKSEACKVDKQNLTTAEENHFAQNGYYAPEPSLTPNFVRDVSSHWDITVTPSPTGTAYALVKVDPDC